MPFLAPYIASLIVGASTGAAYYTLVVVLSVVLEVGLQALSQSLAGNQKGPQGGPQSRDVLVRGTVEPRQMIYGQVRTAGFLAFIGCGGENNKFLYMVCAVAGHQCEAITEFWIDNTHILPSQWNSGSDHLVTNSAYLNASGSSMLKISVYLGTTTDPVDPDIYAQVQAWDATHLGKGVAKVVYRFEFDDKVFASGAPQSVFALVKGRRLYDPRLDSTNGGSGSHRANNATTWTWSQNWALAVRDYISGGSITYDVATPAKQLTLGEKDSRIDDTYIIACANISDELPTVPIPCLAGLLSWTHGISAVSGVGTSFLSVLAVGNKLLGPDGVFYTINTITDDLNLTITTTFAGTSAANVVTQWFTSAVAYTTQKRFTCDVQVSLGDTHLKNLQDLLSSGIGHLSYSGGKYRLYVGVYDSPTVTLTESDIQGPIEVCTHPQGQDLYNYVGGTFFDEDRAWQQMSFPPQTQASYQTDDGDLYPRNIDLRATRSIWRAQRIANVHLQQGRNKTTVNFSALSPKAVLIGEWETFNVNVGEYGWDNQVMRCVEWEFLPSGYIAIKARLEGPAGYSDLAYTDYQLPRNILPAARALLQPAAPTGLTIASKQNAIQFSWPALSYTGGRILTELWEYASSSPFPSATKIWEGYTNGVSIFKQDTTTRYYWIRTRDAAGQVSATYPASTGLAGAAVLTDTTDLNLGSATDVYTNKAKSNVLINSKDTGGDPSNWTVGGVQVANISMTAYPYDVTLVVTAAAAFQYFSTGATPQWYWRIVKFYSTSPTNIEQEYGVIQPAAGSTTQDGHTFRAEFWLPADARSASVSFLLCKGAAASAGDTMYENSCVFTVEVIKR